jgi:hypothetical protein
VKWLDSVIKDVKSFKVEAWWKKALDRGGSGGGSSKRPRSIKDCRARGRRRTLPLLSISLKKLVIFIIISPFETVHENLDEYSTAQRQGGGELKCLSFV